MNTSVTNVWVTARKSEFMISCDEAMFSLKIAQLFSKDEILRVSFTDKRRKTSYTLNRHEFDSANEMRCAFDSEVLDRAY